jgi:hypothetical protein
VALELAFRKLGWDILIDDPIDNGQWRPPRRKLLIPQEGRIGPGPRVKDTTQIASRAAPGTLPLGSWSQHTGGDLNPSLRLGIHPCPMGYNLLGLTGTWAALRREPVIVNTRTVTRLDTKR